MDEKKVKKAIETIKNFPEWNIEDYWLNAEEMEELIEILIEALEKQLPKKPKQRGVTTKDGVFHPINGINGVPYDLCPNCEENLCTDGILGRSKKYMKYCEMCGQRLDWSE